MSLIASVLELSRSDVKALRLTDPYALHRVVYSLFDDVRSDAEKGASHTSGILYADQGGDFEHRTILLLSNRPPAPHINGEYGRVRSRSIAEDFLSHTRYRFKVIVNPTRRENVKASVKSAQGKKINGKLLPVKGREAIAQWFLQRATHSWGFEVDEPHLQIDKVQVLQFQDKAQRPVTLAQAHVQGQLTVTDHAQFQHSFSHGIGRGRAFGCGLLQIVPLVDHPFA